LSGFLRSSRHSSCERLQFADAFRLPGKEPPRLIPSIEEAREHDGYTGYGAKLVALELGLIRLEETAGIQIVVPMQVEQGAVQIVGPALGNSAELATRLDAVFGSVEYTLDLELLDGVRVDEELERAVGLADHGAIQHTVVVGLAQALDVELHSTGKCESGARRLDAWGKRAQSAEDVSGLQGQARDLLVVDHLSQFRRFRFQNRCRRLYLYYLGYLTNTQRGVDAIGLTEIEFQSGA